MLTEEKKAGPSEDLLYGPHWYLLDKATLDEMRKLEPHKPILAALGAWAWIFLLVKTFLFFPHTVYFYPLFAFLIAGRAGVFLQLAHEAAHGLISKGKFNDWFGDWIASYPIGLDLKGYKDPHLRHHACTNQVCDPLSDSEKYRVCDIRNPKLLLLFLKDLLGITALTIKMRYDQPLSNKNKKDIQDYLENEEGYTTFDAAVGKDRLQALKKQGSIALVQLLILGALFNFNLLHYFFLWFLPLMTCHMLLMRVRGIAEHGLGVQLDDKDLEKKTRGLYYTRSFGTPANRYRSGFLIWLERFLIGSLDVYYHHEHHLYPKVPYYNLSKVHRLIAERVKTNNPNAYASGYFDCLFFNLRHSSSPASR